MGWTNERVETLKELWISGLSASQIAQKMGGGISRNAVIGKVHRLGLSGRAKPPQVSTPHGSSQNGGQNVNGQNGGAHPKRGTTKAAGAGEINAKAETPSPAVSMLTPEQRGSVLNLNEHTCKWPIGDPGTHDFHFCGVRAKTGSPYCETHVAIAYQPQTRRQNTGKHKAAQK
ncbi:MAG: GcrA cell cycle regulator [Alphaproteobacteria bacterium]|nr:GcrA cell cycle regulator [Alphaproteobacteria bacterium]